MGWTERERGEVLSVFYVVVSTSLHRPLPMQPTYSSASSIIYPSQFLFYPRFLRHLYIYLPSSYFILLQSFPFFYFTFIFILICRHLLPDASILLNVKTKSIFYFFFYLPMVTFPIIFRTNRTFFFIFVFFFFF